MCNNAIYLVYLVGQLPSPAVIFIYYASPTSYVTGNLIGYAFTNANNDNFACMCLGNLDN